MPKTTFLIIGPPSPIGEVTQYWNNQSQWINDIMKATRFGKDIFALPLPPGSYGIMEINEEDLTIVNIYKQS